MELGCWYPFSIFSKSTQPHSCNAQALLRPVHNFKFH